GPRLRSRWRWRRLRWRGAAAVALGAARGGLGLTSDGLACLRSGFGGALDDLRADDDGCGRSRCRARARARAGPSARAFPGTRSCPCSASTATGGGCRRLGRWCSARSAGPAPGTAAALGVIEHLLGLAAPLGLGWDRERTVERVLRLLLGSHLLVEVEADERHEAVDHVGRER